ncbi:MAG: polysulfide reductase NrfD [bacterium]|nr:polysulfide reductase NrfD [bacterium]
MESAAGISGFIFPNEFHVVWSVMIVLYPYITGLVAGSFIVSSLYHVFGMKKLKPVAEFSLVACFFFLLFATIPLLLHLGKPDRALNIMITPNFTSAMAGFGFLYSTYLLIVVVEIWFVYREKMIRKWEAASNFLGKKIYYLVLLGSTRVNENTRKFDHKVVTFLAGLGIPVAVLLHGYVGFMFGAIKANPWWATPLMFIIFIFSAIASGLAVLIFLYQFVLWRRKAQVEQETLDLMSRLLWAFIIVALALELMEILTIAYEQTEKWVILKDLISQKLQLSYIWGQLLIGGFVPFLLLGASSLFQLPRRVNNLIVWFAASIFLGQVFLMRWNVIIGGQLISKSFRGFTNYMPVLFKKEGLISAVIIFTIPFLLLRAFDKLFPFFPGTVKKQ